MIDRSVECLRIIYYKNILFIFCKFQYRISAYVFDIFSVIQTYFLPFFIADLCQDVIFRQVHIIYMCSNVVHEN